MGDWDGDGVATPGLYRQSDGFVYIRHDNSQGNADLEFFFGNPGDVPVVGDFDGDGRDTVSIWRPSEARMYVINELGRDGQGLGILAGDWDSDGDDTVAVFRPSNGMLYVNLENTGGAAVWEGFIGPYPWVVSAGNR